MAIAAPVSAQNVARRGPAPVAPGIDAPTRRLPTPRRSRPPHEASAPPAAAGSERRRSVSSPAVIRATSGSPLPLLASFEGAEFEGHSLDYVVAAGPQHLMLATNDGLALKSKDGTVVASLANMATFFDSVRQPQEHVGDPRVIYDPGTGRFFVAAIGFESRRCLPGACVAHFFVAVSKRSAPSGLDVADWYFYALDATLDGDTPTARWADFVQLGLNDAVVVLTANMNPFGGSSGSVTKIRILDKAQLVRGQPVSWTDFVDVRDPSSGATFFRPALHSDRTERFFLLQGCSYREANAATVLEIKDALSSPSLSFQSIPIDGCQELPYGVAQPPPGRPLSLGAPGAVVYRNNSLWNAESTIVDTADTQVAGVLWYQIDVSAWPAAALVQTSVLADADRHYFMPALIVDDADNMAMIMAGSSAVEAGSLYYTGRLVSDPAGSLRTPALLKAGTASLFAGDDRYGDYFGAAIDASDGSAWLVGQFASATTETTSWVGKVGLPGYAGRRLLPGQSIQSANGRIRLLYQADGDLVLYDDDRRELLWSSGTRGTPPGRAILQLDGDLVVYDGDGSVRWSSGTGGNRNAYLAVQDDGNLVIFSWDGRPIWDRLRDRREH
jgi:hypothetical protein